MRCKILLLIIACAALCYRTAELAPVSGGTQASVGVAQVRERAKPKKFQDAADSLPNISFFETRPSDRFLVDLDEITSGHPYKGIHAAQPHAGGHVHFDNSANRWIVDGGL